MNSQWRWTHLPSRFSFGFHFKKGKHNQDRRDINFSTKLRHDPVKLLEEYITITGCTWMVLCVAIGNFIVQTICLMGDMYMHNPVCWSVVCHVFNTVQRCRAVVEPVFWTCGCVGARISGFTYAFVVCDFTLDTNTPNNTGKKGYHRLLTIDSSLVRKVVMKIEVNKCTFVVIVSRQITWNLDNGSSNLYNH